MTLSSVDFVAFALVTLCFFLLRLNKRARLPLPPGPPRWPVVGSMFSMPKSNETLDVFNNWGKEYGDVTHARVLDKDFIVLNSREATVELLERRSIMYSSRPRMVMANELVGWGGVVSTMSYGEYFKRSRKLLYEGMSPKAMETLRGPQEQEAIRFARRLLDTPEDLLQHIRQTAGATVIKLTYGYHIEDRYDHLLSLVEKVEETFSIVTTPGLFLVDVFPWLKYVPWAPFKFKAKEWGKLLTDLREQPAEYTREQMKKGTSEPCLMGRWFERMEDSGTVDDEKIIKWAGTAIVAAGTDTTVSAISFFFAALVHYPEVQAAAQAEIDRIVGTNRLPTYSDRGSLKYVEALYKEVLRWNPVTPFGLPHRMDSDKDDVYRGMRIPRGSIVIANIWAMARDPSVYRDPESFMPERFLQSHHELDTAVEMDPENFVFGFGRRRCPGIHVAQSSVWLSIVLTLAVYDVTAAVGSDGKPELPNLNHPQTALNHPEPFKCTIKPRSSRAKKLIQDSVATMSN